MVRTKNTFKRSLRLRSCSQNQEKRENLLSLIQTTKKHRDFSPFLSRRSTLSRSAWQNRSRYLPMSLNFISTKSGLHFTCRANLIFIMPWQRPHLHSHRIFHFKTYERGSNASTKSPDECKRSK